MLQGGASIGFQPALDAGTATSWTWSGYPAGCSFNGSTGALTISPTEAGVFIATVTATNGDGTSDPVNFYIPVEGANGASTGPDVDLVLDVESRAIRRLQGLAGAGAADEAPSGVAPAIMQGPVAAELMRAKAGEDVLVLVHPQRTSGAGVDLGTPLSVTLTLKELDTDGVLVTSAAWAKVGSGTTASYRIRMTLPALLGVLSNYSDDTGTRFAGHGEIEIAYPDPYISTLGNTFTVDATTNVVTTGAVHRLAVGDAVQLVSATTLPAGSAAATTYYVLTVPSSTTLTLSATAGGSTLDFTNTGTGVHHLSALVRLKSDTFIMTISAPQA